MKDRKIFFVLAVVFFSFLTGCATSYIPECSKLREIEKIPYKKNMMDCKHKSVMYHNHLKSKGIKSRVVEGIVKTRHAWVEVEKDGKRFMIDPTTRHGDDGWEVNEYTERKIFYVYNDDVTVNDIRNKKYEKVFIKNLLEWYGLK